MSFCAVNNNQLLNNVDMLNEMNPWNSWDCQLVNLDGIEKLIFENQETIRTTSDWSLCQSLSELGRRVYEEPYFSSEAKVLAKIIASLIPIHLYCDPDQPSFISLVPEYCDPDKPSIISLVPEDIRDNVIQHLVKRELIQFGRTSKNMHQATAKWMPIKTEELLLELFNLCIENNFTYTRFNYEQIKDARFQISLCNLLPSGSKSKIDSLRKAFIPLFVNLPPFLIKSLPSIFYDDKPLIIDLIKISRPINSFKYDDTTYNNKFELAYLDLLIENKVTVLNLDLNIDLIDQKIAHTFADLIRNSGSSWQITLLNVPVKYNFWGTKVIDNSPEGYQVIKTAINEKKYSQLTYHRDESCDYEIYDGSGLKNTWLPR